MNDTEQSSSYDPPAANRMPADIPGDQDVELFLCRTVGEAEDLDAVALLLADIAISLRLMAGRDA
jgi:hypothetical protein